MAENYGFFNAVETAGTYDRVYDASSFAKVFSLFMTNGVFAKEKTSELQVKAKSGLTVTVKAGRAFIDGYWYELTEDMDVTISANTKSYAIKDVICCTLDKTERKVSIILNKIPIANTRRKSSCGIIDSTACFACDSPAL